MKSWQELIAEPVQPDTPEAVLLQCIATISTHPNYSKLTPEEVFQSQVKYARQTCGRVSRPTENP